MSSFSEVKLNEIASFQNGGAWTADKYSDSGIPVIRVSDIHNETIDLSECKYLPERLLDKYKKHELKEDDLVICTVGSHPTQPNSVVGRSCRVPSKGDGALLNQNAVRIRPAVDKLDKIYLAYLGASNMMRNYIIAHARGSASQVRMSIGNLKKFTFELPPLETQQKIASILSAYDELIENNTRRIEILEEMARRIYREWFVHFRYPGHEEDELVDSGTELGEIPEGWEVKKLEDFGEIVLGKTPSTRDSENYGNYMPFIKTPDMHDQYFVHETDNILSKKGVETQKKKTLPADSICVSCIGTAGVVAITSIPSQTNQQINSIVPENSVLREYLYFTAKTLKPLMEKIGSTGATMTNVSKTKFKRLPALSAPADVINKFHDKGWTTI